MKHPQNMMTVAALLIATGCAGFHPTPGPVAADRPGYGDSPDVLPAGAIEMESGYSTDRDRSGTTQSTGELLTRVGVGGGTELRFFGNSFVSHFAPGTPAQRGMEDAKIGLKSVIIDQPDSAHGIIPSVSLLVATSVPTGGHAIGAGALQPEAQLAAAWKTGSPFDLYANAGVNAERDGVAWSVPGWMCAGTSSDLFGGLAVFGEFFNVFPVQGDVRRAMFVGGGFTLQLGERTQLDAHIERGVSNGVSSERSFGFGIARRF